MRPAINAWFKTRPAINAWFKTRPAIKAWFKTRPAITIILGMLIALPLSAQELSRKEKRELRRQLKQEQKEEEASKKAAVVTRMVENAVFVLEADRLRDKYGNTVNVSPTINFIASDSTAGVIQIGQNGYVGLNGVGGITVDGPIDNYEYTRNERNGTYQVEYMLRSSTGIYDVRMTVFPEGRAEATVTSNWPGRLNYSGYLVPPALSRVYKGMAY